MWKPGDLAWIDISHGRDPAHVDGELCMLHEFLDDKKYKGGVVPKAWRVRVFRKGSVDKKLVSEYCLVPTDHPNTKTNWTDCPWQPIEYVRYP